MRVLQVHSSYRQSGGEDSVVEREASLLTEGGHQVLQHIVPNPEGGWPTVRALSVSSWNPNQRHTVTRIVEDWRPDVVHVHNTWFSLSPSILGGIARCGVPVVATLHNYRLLCVNGLLFRQGGPCERCVGRSVVDGVVLRCYRGSAVSSAAVAGSISIHRLLSSWTRHVDALVVMSEFARSKFVAGGYPPAKLRIKPHFSADPGPRPRSPSESSSVLYVGRLSPEKGVAHLLDAWVASGMFTGLNLTVVGDGPTRSELMARGAPNVTFAGSMPPGDVRRLMLEARALVFPSLWYETFGLVMVEAMATGLPVCASRLGGTAELLSDLPDECLVEPVSPKGWESAISRLGDDEWVDSVGAMARGSYEARYTPEVGLSNLVTLYEEVLG